MGGHRAFARSSLAPILVARALYQFYLSTFVVTFGVVAALFVIIVLLIAAFAVVGLSIEGAKALGMSGDSVGALAYLGPFFGAAVGSVHPIATVIMVLVFAVLAPPIAALIFVTIKGATEDRLTSLAVALAFVAAMLAQTYSENGVAIGDASKAMTFFTFLSIAPFLALHLAFAIASRAFRFPRLSAGAPRIGIGGLMGKYVGPRWGRFWREVGAAGPALGAAFGRALVFAFVLSAALLGFGFVTRPLPTLEPPWSFWVPMAPLLIAFAVAVIATLWSLVRRPGLRLMNVALLVTVLPNLPWSATLALTDFGRASPLDTQQTMLNALPAIGSATMALWMIACRGWLLAPVRRAFSTARRNLIRTASEIAADSRKRPILLLRAFADDQTRVQGSYRAFAFGFGAQDATASLEEAVAEALFARGPVIALSDPRAAAPAPLGAARDATPDANWQDYVVAAIDQAHLIAVVIGKGQNLAWEIEQVVARGALERTLFIAPPGYPHDRNLAVLSPIVLQAFGLDAAAEAKFGRGTRAIAFDRRKGRWTAFSSLTATERAYAEAVRIAAGVALFSPRPVRGEGRAGPAAP